jgi:MinD-like ATPase involved in chromosome partitioning or flagellar assembly
MSESRYGRVVTFYSYKGGVGRTLALADVAVHLARMGRRVLMVDWDLEAPGLDTCFAPWLDEAQANGVLELVLDFERVSPALAAAQHEVVRLPPFADRLGLLRAGRNDAGHPSRVQELSWDERYQAGFGGWLEDVRAAWQRSWDFILVDSRTGISDTGGICSMQLPEILVTLFSPNLQSIAGASRMAEAAVAGQQRLPIDRAGLQVVPVLSRVDHTEHELRRKWEAHAVQTFRGWVDAWSDAPDRTSDLMQALTVPHVPYWSYGDQVPAALSSSRDRFGVEYAHETLALLLDLGLADVGRLLDERPRVMAESDHARFPYDVFVSYAQELRHDAGALVTALRARGVRAAWYGDVKAGPDWHRALADLRRLSRDTIILLGPEIVAGQAQEIEDTLARHASRPGVHRVIPVVSLGAPIPRELTGFQPMSWSDADRLAGIVADGLRQT